jgi:hypothetical protein
MTEDPDNSKANRPGHRLASAIGGGLGTAAGLAIGKLIGFENYGKLIGSENSWLFWRGAVLVAGCAGLGVFVAQKIASK